VARRVKASGGGGGRQHRCRQSVIVLPYREEEAGRRGRGGDISAVGGRGEAAGNGQRECRCGGGGGRRRGGNDDRRRRRRPVVAIAAAATAVTVRVAVASRRLRPTHSRKTGRAKPGTKTPPVLLAVSRQEETPYVAPQRSSKKILHIRPTRAENPAVLSEECYTRTCFHHACSPKARQN